MRQFFKENPTFIFSMGFAYITILGYFSSSKYLSYFGIKATDYFTFEDFLLSIVRDFDLFLWLGLTYIMCCVPALLAYWSQKRMTKRNQDVVSRINELQSSGELDQKQEAELKSLVELIPDFIQKNDVYPDLFKQKLKLSVFLFLFASIPAARQVANYNYLEVKTGTPDVVDISTKDSVSSFDSSQSYILILRTANYTVLLTDKSDNLSSIVLRNDNILSVRYIDKYEKSS
ncbi:hypothetical protein LQM11_004941 [Vibrio parahaemolyticus]|uniref:hypothetical protein n=3 Tax=Vibrio parahaemolyticus TaxID=670 RepID=UPI001120B91F|nr:hypothetical protein [Vibrio parahaemolyticus]EIO4564274.1 hypothetical protein [Vibrio parahaemolyticus]EIO4614845.1 hypothetical protein [Vibrio parahaemolyticus]ELA7847889.1 hypothetical protein [Vibrio parahaemolyticus]ELA9311771.1 hypothetical protein [Vibrio parahaemolyticus]TOB32393.1 hypothetical protein CGK07_23220 [Vibrio parahaemolyticus]